MPVELDFLSQITGSFALAAAGNATVAMIEAAYRHHGLDWRYLNCEGQPENLGDAVRGARAMGWAGFNCSLPHKVAVIDHLDGLGESAAIMRAVSRGDAFMGENTDGKGFLMSLDGIVDPRGKKVIIFGAGGAARALVVELALAGATSITIVNRSRERGAELVKLLNDRTPTRADLALWNGTYKVPADADIVINCTSIGLYPHVDGKLDLDTATLRPGLVVADIVPSPPRTNLIRAAEAQGATIVDGLGMLVNQGVMDRSGRRRLGHAPQARGDLRKLTSPVQAGAPYSSGSVVNWSG